MTGPAPVQGSRLKKWFIAPLRRGLTGALGLFTIVLPLALALFYGFFFAFVLSATPVAVVDSLFDPGFEPYARIQPWEKELPGHGLPPAPSGNTEVRLVHLDTPFYAFDFMQRRPANIENARAELLVETVVWHRRSGRIVLAIVVQTVVFVALCTLWAWIIGLIASLVRPMPTTSAPRGSGGGG